MVLLYPPFLQNLMLTNYISHSLLTLITLKQNLNKSQDESLEEISLKVKFIKEY